MAFFKRNKSKNKKKKREGAQPPPADEAPSESASSTQAESSIDAKRAEEPRESSPQRVGIVSGVLTTSATTEEADEAPPRGEIVDRHFGPDRDRKTTTKKDSKPAVVVEVYPELPPRRPNLKPIRTIDDPLEHEMDSPKLEIDPMAHIGHATTITGNIMSEEDLEIQGTIEGSVRLANHQLTVGADGLVKATVEAHSVFVLGRITGDVVASDLVEIKAGGVIGGDVKAPRIIMHDGGVVVGGLDMSAALPSSGTSTDPDPEMPERPRLKSVDRPRDASKNEGSA